MTSQTIQCSGCEAQCEVVVELRDGHAVCLGGNNCPTGECYARARALATAAHLSKHPHDNTELKPK